MLLDVQDVNLTLDEQPILYKLNLKVAEGHIHSILGVNGVGKSTLAYLLMGLQGLRPNTGRILFDGEDITQASITERARRGMTLAWQAPASFEGLTVRHYLKLSGNQAGSNGKEERIPQSLRMVGLTPEQYLDRFVDERLSGGERRRIELASVVNMQPRLAILDEPDSGIDFFFLLAITNVIRHMRLQGSAGLLTIHREEMALMANQSSLMCAGQVIASGDPHAVAQYFREHCDDCKHPNIPDLNGEINELQQGI